MRNKAVKKAILPILGLSLVLGSSLVLATKSKEAEQVSGYSASSLPTTIDLNDTSAENIRSYYSSLNNLSESERKGTNLLKNLKTILKNGQKYYSYENGTSIWQMYEITDRDWDKSPADSTTYGTYNSSTNKITNYTYGTSKSSSKNNPYIHALYINRDVNNQTTAWDDHDQDQWGINREHVWPKAEGFDSSGAGGARGDPMHLMAGNGYANNIHSNYYYGYVKTSSSYTDCGTKYSNQSGNLRGTSKTLNSGTVFEPQDCDKGDIARAIFYMVARYNYLSGSDSDGIDTNNPNLTLTQNISDWSSSGYTSSKSTQGKLGVLTDLLAWHHADPVDEYEKHRNNLLYTNFTNNRNPFIDFPEWADFIWGTATYNGTTYESYDSEPTGYATPSSDTINGYNSGGGTDPVSVTGVSLNVNSTSITIGSSEVLSVTVLPSNATNKAVSWTSSNNNVATVSSSGRVEGVAEGNATITVTTSDGSFTATCTVAVTASGGGGGGVSETSYVKIDSLSDLESGDYVIAADLSSSYKGMTYTFSNGKYSGTDVSVSNDVVSSTDGNSRKFTLSVSGSGDTRSVTIKDTNANKYIAYNSSTNLIQNTDAYTWTVSLGGTNGTFRFTSGTSGRGLIFRGGTSNVYGGYSTNNVVAAGEYYDLELFKYTEVQSEKSLDSISLDTSDAPTTFNVGDTFSYEGLSVTAYYDDGTDDIVAPTSVSTPSMSSAGQKTVTVSYTEDGVTKSATYTITVNAVTLTSIEVSGAKTAYYVGDTFVKPTVTATYSNGSTSDVTNSATFSGYNLSNAGNQTVSVSYTNGTTVNTSYSITVTAVELSSISVSTVPTKTTYTEGEYFDPTGLVITRTYNNSSSDTYAYANHTSEFTFTPSTSTALSTSNTSVTISYGGKSTSQTITVSASAPSGPSQRISASTTSGNYQSGDICPTGSTTSATASCDAFDVSWLKNSGGNIVYTYAEMRVYQYHSFTITPKTDYTITSVVITCDDNSNTYPTNIGGSSLNNCTKDVSGVTVTLTPTNGSNAVGFTNNAQSRIDYIVVYYSQSGSSSEPSVSWSAPTINVYSGSTLSESDVNAWAVTYNDGAGHQSVLTYSQLTVKLGGTTISIPHTWVTADDGKSLTATYNSLTTTASSAVQITQSINAVAFEQEATYTHTSTSKWSSHSTTQTLSGVSWTPSITWSTTEPASGVQNVDGTKGQQIGTGSNPARVVNLSTSEIGGTISSIVVNASTASSATASISIKVGGSSFGGNAKSLSTSAANYTFEGSASGTVEIILSQPSTSKALYLKSITIGYTANANIANNTEHIEAQRLAVLFAKTFNEFMDDTQNCTTGLDAAWASCSTAYTLFKSSAASLGETEQAWCLNLIKYATAQYSDDSGEACIERMMKTYEVCVQKHGKTAFMSDLVTLGSNTVSPLVNVVKDNKPAIIIVIVSLISASTIAGYFFIKRRKPE